MSSRLSNSSRPPLRSSRRANRAACQAIRSASSHAIARPESDNEMGRGNSPRYQLIDLSAVQSDERRKLLATIDFLQLIHDYLLRSSATFAGSVR